MPNLSKRRIIAWAVGLLAAITMINLVRMIDHWKRDLTTNHAQLEPDAKDPDLRPLSIPLPLDRAVDLVTQWAQQTPQWSVESVEQDVHESVIRLTHTTKWLRFTDDVIVHLKSEPATGSTMVYAESRSRIGKGDLGQNPRNLKALVQGIRAAVQPATT